MLLGECERIDMEGGLNLLTEERTKLEQEWEITSLLLVDAEKKLQNIVIMTNRMSRNEAVLKSELSENARLSN